MEPLDERPMPARPMSLPTGSGLPASPPPDPMARFTQAMRLIIPALAAAGAYKQGALGSFTGGFLDVTQARAAQEAQAADRDVMRDLQRQGVDLERQRLLETTRQHDWERDQASLAATIQAKLDAEKQAQTERTAIERALTPFSGNPLYSQGIDPEYAANAVVTVPGIGPINLREALERVGAVTAPDGKYLYGTYKAPETPTTRAFTTTEANGDVYRVTEDAAGRELSRRRVGRRPVTPDKPEKPKAPPQPTVKVETDPVTSEATATFTDPGRGVTLSLSQAQVAELLDAKGLNSDPATVLKVMRNPQAMQELVQ